MNSNSKLWGGRFSASTDSIMEAFSSSVDFDRRLFSVDIDGSIAHARMLTATHILTEEECTAIIVGLTAIREEIISGDFIWSAAHEDVHMNIEAALTERVGEAGKKLHTARSRNDQVATDIRLYLRETLDGIEDRLNHLLGAIIDLAEREADTLMPGFTHMQIAQPVTFGHHLLAWFEMLIRDRERFLDCRRRLNISPLGSAALAGTSFPIDRKMTATELGFDGITENSLDAVSDRDFAIEFGSAGALLMIHLSRISEELVLWSTDRFGFIDLGDAFCTGSSIMPQKKNPDVAELIRGKSGRVVGNLNALLVLMKGQPLAYNRDNQEDKEPLFDTADTLNASLDVMGAMVPEISVNREQMREAASQGFATATDLADYLVRKGVPFRDAHEVVGQAVRFCIDEGLDLAELSLSHFHAFSSVIEEDVYGVLTLEGSVAARDHVGGTAPKQVRSAIERARTRLQ
ncbi:MAG: argininosuccinate lyase [Arenicellales bacterium]|nr:argininosuccinate lyase [Arenicellales bacterium]